MDKEIEKENVQPSEETSAHDQAEENSQDTPVTEKVKRVINVKLAIAIAVIVVILALLYSARGLFIAATVDGTPISRFAVVHELEKTSGKTMLDALISQQLIASEFKRSGLSVPPSEIDAEVEKLRKQVAEQGSTPLETLLAGRGMTMEDLRKQFLLQKQVEKLLADKVTVTDAEVEAYISGNKLKIPEEQLATAKVEIADELRQQKLSTEGGALLERLHTAAKINYFVSYEQ